MEKSPRLCFSPPSPQVALDHSNGGRKVSDRYATREPWIAPLWLGSPPITGFSGRAGGVTTVEPAPNKRGKVTLVPWSPGAVGGGVLRVTTLREGSPPPSRYNATKDEDSDYGLIMEACVLET